MKELSRKEYKYLAELVKKQTKYATINDIKLILCGTHCPVKVKHCVYFMGNALCPHVDRIWEELNRDIEKEVTDGMQK